MKKITVLLIALITLTSCNFTEEITFNADGSGEFVMSYDMSEVMAFVKDMGGSQKTNDENKKKNKKVDSVVYFKDLFAKKSDSIATLSKEEQDKLKALENVVMKVRMDEEAGIFDFGFGSEFKSLEDLPQVLKTLEEARKQNAKESMQFSKMESSEVAKSADNILDHVDFKYDGQIFSRSLLKSVERTEDDQKAFEAEMSQMGEEAAAFFEEMTYTMVYHFPSKIKKVSNKNATISADGKSVRMVLNFMEMIKDPMSSELNVELEN